MLQIKELLIDIKREYKSKSLEFKSRRKSKLKYLIATSKLALYIT
jgi:hypothetical protein